MGIRMSLKNYTPKISLCYILILLLWGVVSSAAYTTEIADVACASDDCYVNHSSAISPVGRTFPSQKYLSARNLGVQETVSAARGRHIRPLPRTVRNIIAALFYGSLLMGSFFSSGRLKEQGVPSHRFCGIIIANYIHHQDGQKSDLLLFHNMIRIVIKGD